MPLSDRYKELQNQLEAEIRDQMKPLIDHVDNPTKALVLLDPEAPLLATLACLVSLLHEGGKPQREEALNLMANYFEQLGSIGQLDARDKREAIEYRVIMRRVVVAEARVTISAINMREARAAAIGKADKLDYVEQPATYIIL